MYILVPRLAVHLDAEGALPIGRRALTVTYILIDLITVLSQLAGTALTITFGDLVNIGQKVGGRYAIHAQTQLTILHRY